MSNIRRATNLFYFNIFRFERYTQWLFAAPFIFLVKLIGLGHFMEIRSKRMDWDEHILSVLNSPKDGISISMTGKHVTLLIFLVLLSVINLFCGFFGLGLDKTWIFGMIAAIIPGVVISNYVAPIKSKEYLNDFRKFESMPKAKKRKSALITLSIYLGVWVVFLSSFWYYMRSILR